MNWVLPVVVALLGVGYPALFAASTLTRSATWRAKSRVDLLIAGLNAALMLLLVHQFFLWWIVPVVLWLLPVAVLSVGVAGAILAWPTLGWKREGRALWRTFAGAAINVVVVVAVAWVVLG